VLSRFQRRVVFIARAPVLNRALPNASLRFGKGIGVGAALRCLMAVATAGMLASTETLAGTLTWGASGGGGSGDWNTTTGAWWNGATVPWVNANGDTAVFAGTAGTVTLTAPITAGGLTFNTTGYTVTAGTLTLAGGTAAVITTGSTLSASVASNDCTASEINSTPNRSRKRPARSLR